MNQPWAAKDSETLADSIVRILVIEDSEEDFQIFYQNLTSVQNEGVPRWEVVNASCLTRALERLQESKFDLIVLNVALPDDSTGVDSFLSLQSVAPELAVVILSGVENEKLARDLVGRGAQTYLLKDSLLPDLVVRTILHALERKHFELREKNLNADLNQEREEVIQLHLRLIQAEELESLQGGMAAGVAHEVKNPLAILQQGVDYFDSKQESHDQNDAAILGLMKESILRADRVVVGMKDFSRSRDLNLEPVDLNELMERAIAREESALRLKQVVLQREFSSPLPLVEVDRAQIEQVMVNLIANGIDALTEGGTLTVATYLVNVESVKGDQGLRVFDRFRAGDVLVVAEVRDYGTGIPHDKLHKIFDPFFTTKPTGKGTGLGLSTSRKIVQLHNGALQLQNVDPTGVRARMVLPVEQKTNSI